jgi:hypothetical protein
MFFHSTGLVSLKNSLAIATPRGRKRGGGSIRKRATQHREAFGDADRNAMECQRHYTYGLFATLVR